MLGKMKKNQEKLEILKSNAVYRIMPTIMRQIVFAKKEKEEEYRVSRNIIFSLIDKLVELNILVPYSNYAKLGYRYNEIYYVFVDKDISNRYICINRCKLLYASTIIILTGFF